MEWWDALILKAGDHSEYDVDQLKFDAITNLIEHPIQVRHKSSKLANMAKINLTLL